MNINVVSKFKQPRDPGDLLLEIFFFLPFSDRAKPSAFPPDNLCSGKTRFIEIKKASSVQTGVGHEYGEGQSSILEMTC